MEKAQILIPQKYEFLFKVAVEDANKGKIISVKQIGTLTSEEVSDDPFEIPAQEYLLFEIEYKSPQSLFDTGIDFGMGVLNNKYKLTSKSNKK